VNLRGCGGAEVRKIKHLAYCWSLGGNGDVILWGEERRYGWNMNFFGKRACSKPLEIFQLHE
jgi:hypothetical protein